MNISVLMQEMIKTCIKPFLIEQGFCVNNNTFYLVEKGNWILINIQKSDKCTSEKIIFTINLGIASKSLFNFFDKEIIKPSLRDCHLCQRIGFLLPQGLDVWWSIDCKTKLIELGNELNDAINNYAIPFLKKYASDIELRDLWLSNKSFGLTDTQRLIYLTVLLKQLGPPEIFDETVKNLHLITKNKPISSIAIDHINKLIY